MSSKDPSEHLRLIYRVIGQMGLKPWEVDEAYSEGLVAITEASQSYDASRGVPFVNWLATNIRWSIRNWREKQHPHIPVVEDLEHEREMLDSRAQYREVLAAIDKNLTPMERRVILGGAVGFKGKEIAEALGITPVEVSRAKKRAREKLLEILNDTS